MTPTTPCWKELSLSITRSHRTAQILVNLLYVQCLRAVRLKLCEIVLHNKVRTCYSIEKCPD